MADELILRPGWDNTDVVGGLRAMEGLVTKSFATVQARAAAITGGFGNTASALGQLNSRFGRTTVSANNFARSLDRISQGMTSGLGIGVALGGLALLEKGFEKAIEKARAFQTAQLSIASTLTSAYKYQTAGGGKLNPGDSYMRALGDSARTVDEIIKRQAKNILTFQEQLNAYQSSLNAGANKGLNPKQVLDISERLGIVAKSIGLHGEDIGNSARLALGGGPNVSRSVIGRALGLSNVDIKNLQGQGLLDYLNQKTKGFGGESKQNFAQSIGGVLSTTESAVDVFAAKVGQKFFDKTKPIIQELGTSLKSINADKVAETMANLFSAIAHGLETIAKSPLIPEITKFLDLLAGSADKIILAAVILKIMGAMNGAAGVVRNFSENLKGVAISAKDAAVATEATAAATRDLNSAEAQGGLGSRGRLGGAAGIAGAAALGRSKSEIQRELAEREVGPLLADRPGSGGYTNFKQYGGAYAIGQAQHEADIRSAISRQNLVGTSGNLALKSSLAQEGAFGLFAAQQGSAINPLSAEELAAHEASASQAAAAARAQSRAALIDRGTKGLLAGAGAYIGTGFARSALGAEGNENYGAAAVQGGATVGAGLVGAGLGLNPLTLGITAIAAAVSGVESSLTSFDESVKKSTDALEDMAKKYPQAAKIVALSGNQQRDKNALAGKPEFRASSYSAQEQFWYGSAKSLLSVGGLLNNPLSNAVPDTGAQRVPELRSRRTIQAEIDKDEADKRQQRRIGTATAISANQKESYEAQVKLLQGTEKSLGFGYGAQNEADKLSQGARLKNAEILQTMTQGQLFVPEDIKKAADARFSKIQAGIDIKESIGKANPKANISYTDEELKYDTKDKLEQEMASQRLINQNRRGTNVQQQLQPLQTQLNALSLGDSGDNVVTAAELAYKVADIKLKDLQDNFNIPASQIAELRLQNRAKLDVAKLQKAYEENTGDFGDNDYEQALNKARSGLVQKTLARYGDIYGAQGNTPQEGLARKESEIEGKRGEVNDLEAYRGQALSTYEKQNALSALGGGGLTVDEQVSRSMQAAQERLNDNGLAQQAENENFARRTQDRRTEVAENPLRIAEADRNAESAQLNARKAALAPVLESGQGPYGGVASAIQYSVQAEQGFDPQAYEAAYRESIDIKKKEATLAQENANLQVQEAQVARQRLGLQLERTDEDYQKAVNEHNAAIRKLAQSAQELSEGMARAQADLAQAAQYAAGGTNAVRQGAIAEINGLTQQAGIKSFNISPTLNTTVNVTAGEVNLSADELDKIGRTVKDSIERGLDRACKRS